MKFSANDYCHPRLFPTVEEVFDINFNSIVSDLRGITRGTLAPRSWADLSSTWVNGPINRVMHVRDTTRDTTRKKSNYTRVTTDRRRKPFHQKNSDGRIVRRMVRLLEANGMNVWDARMKARELLKSL